MSLRCLPSSLGWISIKVWDERSLEIFQDCHHGSHLECRNGMNLAVLNLHVSPMPLIKFQLNPTYCSWAYIVLGFSSWPPWQPSWILEQTNLAILNLHVTQMPPTKFGLNLTLLGSRHGLKIFDDGHRGGHLGDQKETILAILNLYVALKPPIKFQLNLTYGLGGDVIWRFSDWPTLRQSWISKHNDFSNSNSPCGPNASHQVWAQSDVGLGSRCGFKIFKIAAQGYRNGTILVILLEMLKMWSVWQT